MPEAAIALGLNVNNHSLASNHLSPFFFGQGGPLDPSHFPLVPPHRPRCFLCSIQA